MPAVKGSLQRAPAQGKALSAVFALGAFDGRSALLRRAFGRMACAQRVLKPCAQGSSRAPNQGLAMSG